MMSSKAAWAIYAASKTKQTIPITNKQAIKERKNEKKKKRKEKSLAVVW